ncbi:TonB family protein [Gilvimarinus sp. 1_MG-2023]|uniref:TonB family protein n=1 Tax=Gilvimarinus sp. 1_MG-2023 TaxID=3062638 RepID=UPI0026E24990|nr:TonB family protein [Gilvimarinus sp. 1_MG-2023]MDO6746935.1 TonB family protein [Gilvimarinus sp. 1_MG-2023]
MQTNRKNSLWPAYLMTLLVSLLLIGKAHAEPLLNGMAIHQELGKDRFIGAIYSERLTEAADLLVASNMPMRLEMKITADRGMAARRFSRMWIEGMAINIRSSALTEQADNMVAFTQMFQDRLLENDHIVMALAPGEGTSISVNGVELGRIESDAFFGLLASAWVGRVPLSSTFRDQLLKAGEVSGALQSRYSNIQPNEERRQEVAAWIAPPPPPEPAPEPAVAPEPEPVVAPAPEPTIAAPPIKPPKLELAGPSSVEDPTDTVATNDIATSEPSEPAPDSEVVEDSTPELPIPAKTEQIAASSSSEASEMVDETDEDFVPTFTAESILANQRYFSKLVIKVQREIEYPQRALARGYQGFIRIAVRINRNGDLLSTDLLEEADHSVLNNEALDAVADAAPFAEIPEVISGQFHEFTIPITFALQ